VHDELSITQREKLQRPELERLGGGGAAIGPNASSAKAVDVSATTAVQNRVAQ